MNLIHTKRLLSKACNKLALLTQSKLNSPANGMTHADANSRAIERQHRVIRSLVMQIMALVAWEKAVTRFVRTCERKEPSINSSLSRILDSGAIDDSTKAEFVSLVAERRASIKLLRHQLETAREILQDFKNCQTNPIRNRHIPAPKED